MADCMTFPETVDEFMESYKMVDTEHIYSNGTEYVPIFRMKQWFEHLPERKTGRWILFKGLSGKDYHKCSNCLHTQDITGVKNYCAVCGADMMEVEHD